MSGRDELHKQSLIVVVLIVGQGVWKGLIRCVDSE